MEQENSQMENITLGDVMPAYVRERLQKAKMSATAKQPEEVPEQSLNDDQSTETNEVNSWKGRLSKEQSLHKETQNRLLAESQARAEAEQKAKENADKLTALEQQLQELQQSKAQEESELTDDEIADIEAILGDSGRKLVDRLRNTNQSSDLSKMIDERISAERQRLDTANREQQWQKAIMEQVPEIQGLLNDPNFYAYCQSTEVDFVGNNAITLINETAKNRDIARIPKLRALIDGFNQQQGLPEKASAGQVTAPPNNKGAVGTQPRRTGKRQMTAKDVVIKNRLVREGKTEELRTFLAQFS